MTETQIYYTMVAENTNIGSHYGKYKNKETANRMINEEKQKALEAALGQIEKQYGKGSVMKLGEIRCQYAGGDGSYRIP